MATVELTNQESNNSQIADLNESNVAMLKSSDSHVVFESQMPSKMPKNDGKGSGSSRRGKNNQQTIPSSRTSNRLLEDYQEPDTESDTSVTNYTEYLEGKEEKEAKDLKMKES